MSDEKDKPIEIRFAPGCFDDFEGTQEELDELIADLHRKLADGTLFEQAEPVPEDEARELLGKVKKRQKRQ